MTDVLCGFADCEGWQTVAVARGSEESVWAGGVRKGVYVGKEAEGGMGVRYGGKLK